MFLPSPSLMPLAVFTDIDTSCLDDLEHLKNLSSGVVVLGPAAAYALVWELGSDRLKKPGPKTVWGRNRDGERKIMSSQAPEGYVGVVADKFWPIIEEELSKIDYGGKNLQLQMEVAIDNASQRIAVLVRAEAPVDSGDLRTGIQGVDSGDPTLGGATDAISAATLIL